MSSSSLPPSRSGEVGQWYRWLKELNRDSSKSRRQAEIEVGDTCSVPPIASVVLYSRQVAEKYLRLYQQDRERLEDARTERLRRQIDRIGLDPEEEEEEEVRAH